MITNAEINAFVDDEYQKALLHNKTIDFSKMIMIVRSLQADRQELAAKVDLLENRSGIKIIAASQTVSELDMRFMRQQPERLREFNQKQAVQAIAEKIAREGLLIFDERKNGMMITRSWHIAVKMTEPRIIPDPAELTQTGILP